MGDVTATFAIGNSSVMSGPTVYTDPNGTVSDNSYKVRMAGTYSSALTLGYGTIGSVYFSMSPVKTVKSGVKKLLPVQTPPTHKSRMVLLRIDSQS